MFPPPAAGPTLPAVGASDAADARPGLTFRARSLCVAPSFPRPGVFPVLQRPKLHEH